MAVHIIDESFPPDLVVQELTEKIMLQKKYIKELEGECKRWANSYDLQVTLLNKERRQNTKLKEEIRLLKQYQEIARLNEALEEIKRYKMAEEFRNQHVKDSLKIIFKK